MAGSNITGRNDRTLRKKILTFLSANKQAYTLDDLVLGTTTVDLTSETTNAANAPNRIGDIVYSSHGDGKVFIATDATSATSYVWKRIDT